MAQPFTFPPPPPPPPRRECLPHPNSALPAYASSYSNGSGGGAGGYTRGRGRGDAFRGRGFSARTRGNTRTYQGDYRNGNFNAGLDRSEPIHDSSRGPLYGDLNQQQSLSSSHHGQKRAHSAAFNKPPQQIPRPKAAPAVPIFGGDILPPLASQSAVPNADSKKKPRKHNQLGLTPCSAEHESSSDEDEEAKLAIKYTSTAHPVLLQFEHRGRTTTLQTAVDIAAWISERKKNFPTVAKAEAARKEAEEKKRKWEETKRYKAEAQRVQKLDRDKERQDELRRRALESVGAKKGTVREVEDKPAADTKHDEKTRTEATTKVEKLKRKLEKAQRDARKAEAALAKIHGYDAAAIAKEDGPETIQASALHDEPANADSLAVLPTKWDDLTRLRTELLKDDNTDDDLSDTSANVSLSDLDDDDDATSSSGSLSSSNSPFPSDPDLDSDPDHAPEELTSKRTAPDRVPPPPRIDPSKAVHSTNSTQQTSTPHLSRPCRNMLKTGRCQFGKRCRYSHDRPEDTIMTETQNLRDRHGGSSRETGGQDRSEREQKTKTKMQIAARRKGLYQLLVEKEIEEERGVALSVIVAMGKRGLLGGES